MFYSNDIYLNFLFRIKWLQGRNSITKITSYGKRREIDLDFEDDSEVISILQYNFFITFLYSNLYFIGSSLRMVFTKQLEAMQSVKDPTSDMFSPEREPACKKKARTNWTSKGLK
jgi:hypothetical protein